MMLRGLAVRASRSTPFPAPGITSLSKVISRASSHCDVEATANEKWDLLSAVCLERHPVITKPMRDIEDRYQKMLWEIELENGITPDFEIRKQREQKQKDEATESEVASPIQTAQDLEDVWVEELNKFQLAPRTSETKEDNSLVSLKRKLDKNLLLLVEQKVGDSNIWIPPQSIRKDGESMIQTAHRSLEELCGPGVKVKFYGSAPIGFYRYKYPASVRQYGSDGAKVFYFLAKYIGGNIASDTKHCWLDREELKNTIHPAVHKSLSRFLLPE